MGGTGCAGSHLGRDLLPSLQLQKPEVCRAAEPCLHQDTQCPSNSKCCSQRRPRGAGPLGVRWLGPLASGDSPLARASLEVQFLVALKRGRGFWGPGPSSHALGDIPGLAGPPGAWQMATVMRLQEPRVSGVSSHLPPMLPGPERCEPQSHPAGDSTQKAH
jgi:hypothetical protein